MSSTDEHVLVITDVSITPNPSDKPYGVALIRVGSESRQINIVDINKEKIFRAHFDPPLRTSSNLQLTVQWRTKGRLRRPNEQRCTIFLSELQSDHPSHEVEHEFRKGSGESEIVITYKTTAQLNEGDTSEDDEGEDASAKGGLEPEFDKIVNVCPRFRILIIGKSGVGKTSLIKYAFGIDDAIVSHDERGQTNIKEGHISKDNKRFVLHDSMGFEHGDQHYFDEVQDFIEERKNMPKVMDRLHAVWLCFSTPRAGERVLETGSEKFLKLKMDGILGDIPVIAVFTKYDNLVARVKRLSMGTGASGGNRNVNDALDQIFQTSCVAPLQKLIELEFRALAKAEFEHTLLDLVNLTYENVTNHVSKEVSIVTAIAQRVSPDLKIDGSIAVGKNRYWSGLTSSANFEGQKIEDCLKVVHDDIINVWNFNDENEHLYSREFRNMMLIIADDSSDSSGGNNSGSSIQVSIVTAVSILGSVVAGPAVAIVGGIVGQWAYGTFTNTNTVLRRFMTYIVDLTLVMQTLFGLVAGSQTPLTRRIIKAGYRHYRTSKEKNVVHREIDQFVKNTFIGQFIDQGHVLKKIVELIKRYPLKSEEITKLRGQNKDIRVEQDDEAWY